MNTWHSTSENRDYEVDTTPLTEAEKLEWQSLDENTAEEYLLPRSVDESGNKMSGEQMAYYSPFANQEDEGGRLYPDAWGSGRLQNGKIVYQLSNGGNTPSSYFTDEETVDSCRDLETGKIDADALKRKLQIEDAGHEKNVLTAYVVNNPDGLKAGHGVAEENPQYGAGGGRQYFIPYAGNYKEDGNLQKVGERQNIGLDANNRDAVCAEEQKGQCASDAQMKKETTFGQGRPPEQERGRDELQELRTGQEKPQEQENIQERPEEEQENIRKKSEGEQENVRERPEEEQENIWERPEEEQENVRERTGEGKESSGQKEQNQNHGREEPQYSGSAGEESEYRDHGRQESQDPESAGDRTQNMDDGHEETQGSPNVREMPQEQESCKGKPQERENDQKESNRREQERIQKQGATQKEPDGHDQERPQENGERPDTGYDYYYGYGY